MRAPAHTNIVLVLTDSLRSDTLGCYGNPHHVTPNIDALATSGLRYETACSSSPLCVPARSQLLTGKYCHETGNLQNQAWRYHVNEPIEVDGVCLSPSEITLPMLLAEQGYQTAHLGKNHFYPRDNPYGFQTMEQCDFYGRDLHEKDDFYLYLKEKGYAHLHKDAFGRMDAVGTGGNGVVREAFGLLDRLCPYVSRLPSEHQHTPWLGRRVREFIRRQSEAKPFFLVASFYAPHDPYCVSRPYDTLIDWESMELPVLPRGLQPSARYVGEQSLRTVLPEETWKRNIAHYLANISTVDHEVGEMISLLKEQGLYENTLIVFTSDHGDTLGEHRIWGKNLLYECCTRIPLVFHHGGKKIGSGVSRETATLLDLFPTLLQQTGTETPGARMAGRILNLETPPANPDDRVVIGELGNSKYPQYFVRQGPWKLIYLDGYPAFELYHLDEDPHELVDLSESNPARRDTLYDLLQEWLKEEAPYTKPVFPGADQFDARPLGLLSHL